MFHRRCAGGAIEAWAERAMCSVAMWRPEGGLGRMEDSWQDRNRQARPGHQPVNDAPGAKFHDCRADGVEVRLPTLEVYLATQGSVFAERGRSLTLRERELAFPIFGNSLNYGAVRIAVAPIANAPTTLGNTIRISALLGRPGIPEHTLIHELSHIWQFQTRGTRYISNSLCPVASSF
jgi:hypothetical protein